MPWTKKAREKSIESRRKSRKFSNQFLSGKKQHHPPEVREKISKTMSNDEQRNRIAQVREKHWKEYKENYKETELFTGFYSDGTENDEDPIL
jgi:uncharacterized secreted protein with C-terminal beta-propeller domain